MNRLTPLALAVIVSLALLPGACTEIGTDPEVATELQFDTLPFPAIVLGDSLADDTLGTPMPLDATAFNSRRDELPNAPIFFFPVRSDLGITVDSTTGHVFADSAAATAPLDTVLARGVAVYARVGRLQSQARTLVVTRRPDSLAAIDPVVDTLDLSFLAADTLQRFGPYTVRLLHLDAAGAVADSVRGWPVRFRLTDAQGAPVDTGYARLVDDGDRPSVVDTTETSGSEGRAGRRVRVRAARTAALPDTLHLEADAWYDGSRVRGAPVRFILILREKPAS